MKPSSKSRQHRRTYYLHTLSGSPAYYVPGKQICFASHFGQALRLCATLDDIRREQELSEQWRAKQGYRPTSYAVGYRRVRLP